MEISEEVGLGGGGVWTGLIWLMIETGVGRKGCTGKAKSPGSLMFLMQLWIVFGIVSRAAHWSQHVEVAPCDSVRKVHKSACRGGSVWYCTQSAHVSMSRWFRVIVYARCTSHHVEVVSCDSVRNVHKSQHTKAVPCDTVCKVHFAQLLLPLSSPMQNRLTHLLQVAIFKTSGI
jgi:hypothetical protein